MTDRPSFTLVNGRKIAWRAQPGKGPGIVFLGGFASDMLGTKAEFLAAYCVSRGQAYLRLDYSGHGESEGAFINGCIGNWVAEALAVVDQHTEGPQILVGSSMGGWIALLVARARPERLAGFIGIAAAPDFTEDMMWAGFDDAIRSQIMEEGVYLEPSEYSNEPTPITRRLIEDGRNQLVLRSPLAIKVPVRLIQGMQDPDVDWHTALRLADHIDGDDVDVILRKNGDHRLSSDADLLLLEQVLNSLLG
ncbi:MAG: alpha/beta hydrolase [Alphaproteobacteria bacterium]|nr:MAG: alpha/beta hydrolase [Alphaproteobacteria bacterium]